MFLIKSDNVTNTLIIAVRVLCFKYYRKLLNCEITVCQSLKPLVKENRSVEYQKTKSTEKCKLKIQSLKILWLNYRLNF